MRFPTTKRFVVGGILFLSIMILGFASSEILAKTTSTLIPTITTLSPSSSVIPSSLTKTTEILAKTTSTLSPTGTTLTPSTPTSS